MAREFTGAGTVHGLSTSSAVSAAPLTMACRFNTDSTSATQCMFSLITAASGHCASVQLSAVSATQRAFGSVRDSGGFSHAVTSNSVTAGQWHNAVFRYVSSTSRLVCLDGDIVNQGGNGFSRSPDAYDAVEIGWFGPSSTSRFDGRLAECCLWSDVLDDEDVLAFNEGLSPLLIRPELLAGYWPLIGRFSPEIDLVGDAPLVLTGSPAQASHTRVIMPARKRLYVPLTTGNVFNVSVNVAAPRSATVQRNTTMSIPTITSPHPARMTLVTKMTRAVVRATSITVTPFLPAITSIVVAVTAAWNAGVSLTAAEGTRKFVGSAGLAGILRRRTRWGRRR